MGKYKNEFCGHQSLVYNIDSECIYIMGGNGNKNSNLMFDNKTVKVMASMPMEKTFFATVYFKNKIYTFGGYDNTEKVQSKDC